MTLPTLGTLVEVSVREAWRYEAHTFTPWLAQHLDALGTVVGVPLELEGQEVAVEEFSADILARNPTDDSLVLIENQLEATNHTHLGQILTYLAGLDATVVIWVATAFRKAHLTAVRWLNEHVPAPFAFFAVRVRVVRIGDSALAPVFEVLVEPDAFERNVRAATGEGSDLTDLGKFRVAFWRHYLERHPDDEGKVRATCASNQWRKIDALGLVISSYVARQSVGIFVRGLRGVSPGEAYNTLAPHHLHLAELTGAELGDSASGSFFWQEYRADTSDRGNWDELTDWLHKTTKQYEAALRSLEA